MMKSASLNAIASVAYKEFLHIYRDRRILILLLILPPLFTLIFGHAFEANEMTEVPALLINRDNTPLTQRFVDIVSKNKTFDWRRMPPTMTDEADLLGHHVQAALVIPSGWSESLRNGDPKPIPLYLDGSDTNTANELEGSIRQSLGDFQMKERDRIVETLPEKVFELGKKLPVEMRKQFVSLMDGVGHRPARFSTTRRSGLSITWCPGIIGLILQLLTVTLMACTIARERESGTLYQLLVTSLQRREIVIGKILPYLAVSIVLIVMIMALSAWHFGVRFYQPSVLAVICLLFLLCSLGLGLLISAFSRTQTQAIQFSVFFLLPVFVLSGAFAPLEQLPRGDPLHLGNFSAHPFLPRFPAGEHVPRGCRRFILSILLCCWPAPSSLLSVLRFLLKRIEE